MVVMPLNHKFPLKKKKFIITIIPKKQRKRLKGPEPEENKGDP